MYDSLFSSGRLRAPEDARVVLKNEHTLKAHAQLRVRFSDFLFHDPHTACFQKKKLMAVSQQNK